MPFAPPELDAVILVVVDDLGLEQSRDEMLMPHLCRMRAEGLWLPHYYTPPVCEPSRMTLMTGCYTPRTGVTGNMGRGQEWGPRLPTMRDLGFPVWSRAIPPPVERSVYGKWRFGDSQSNGAMSWVGWDDWAVWDPVGPDGGDRHHLATLQDGFAPIEPAYTEAYCCHRVIRQLGNGIEDARPQMIYWPMLLVHDPVHQPPGQPDSSRESMIRHADRLIGHVAEYIRITGMRAIILVTSDNGAVGEGKRELTPEGCQVGMTAWGPGIIQPGFRSSAVLDATDVAPTLCALWGAEMPDVDGHSFAPLLIDPEWTGWPREVAVCALSARLVPYEGRYLIPADGRPSQRAAFMRGKWQDGVGRTWNRQTVQTGERIDDAHPGAAKLREAREALPEDRRIELL